MDGSLGQYRPITCLDIMYKILTDAPAVQFTDHVERRGILPHEQKAMRKGTRGAWMRSR